MTQTSAYVSAVPRRRISRADRLFTQFDQQRVGAGPDSWIVTVFGVHIEQHEMWIQVGPSHDPGSSVVLRMPESCTSNHALAALEAWLKQPAEERPHVIDVMRCLIPSQ